MVFTFLYFLLYYIVYLICFQFLKKSCPTFLSSAIKWNFTKFLVDRRGVPRKRYAPNYAPEDITIDLEEMLSRH